MRLLRISEVCKITGLPRSSVYLAMSQRLFPRPVKIGRRSVGWRSSDIYAWLESRPSAQPSSEVTRDHTC
jgi:prophage regulatory protein